MKVEMPISQTTASIVEITDNLPAAKLLINELTTALRNSASKSRERSMIITKLDEARLWVDEAMRVE